MQAHTLENIVQIIAECTAELESRVRTAAEQCVPTRPPPFPDAFCPGRGAGRRARSWARGSG